jgi:signal transduction histidine kinase
MEELELKFNNFRFINSGSTAFLIVVCAAYASALTTLIYSQHNLSSAEIVVLSAAGVAYLVIGTVGFSHCCQMDSKLSKVIYFAVQLFLAAVMILLRGPAVELPLILLPLAGQSALLLPLRMMLAFCVLIYLTLMMPLLVGKQWVNAFVIAIVHGTGIVFAVVFTRIAASERNARQSLSEANLQLREHATQIEELATTKERNRLAREIHDSLGHYLTVVNVQIEAARAIFPHDSNRAFNHLAQAQTLTQEGLAEVRRSVAALRASPLVNLPLTEALAKLTEQWNTADTRVDLKITGAVRRLAPAAELTLYRTAQEALTNVGKHAEATQVKIWLDFSDDQFVILKVEDNGCGSDNAEEGFGLLGVRERVHALKGKVKIHTAPSKGFRLEAEVPE